jgi:hypothetical protein
VEYEETTTEPDAGEGLYSAICPCPLTAPTEKLLVPAELDKVNVVDDDV